MQLNYEGSLVFIEVKTSLGTLGTPYKKTYFASEEKNDKNLPLLKFFKNEFGLNMSNDCNLSTTRYKTTIDAVFTRYLNKFESKLFVSYFSYHKPIVSVLEIGDDAGSDDGARVGEMMDGN
ncbi:trimethylguanosine synthase-like, partial [Aphis craccivora]